MVEYSSRCTYHHMRPLAKGIKLMAVSDAAINLHVANSCARAQSFYLVRNLAGQFASWYQYQGLTSVSLYIDTIKNWENKSPGLAAAGARLDHQIAPGKKIGDGLGLNRHQTGPVCSR